MAAAGKEFKPKCWLCTAPFRQNTQGFASYLRCKGCGIVSHPGCAAKRNCCFSVDNEEVFYPVSAAAKRSSSRKTTLPTHDERNLDMSFVFSSSPNLVLPALQVNSTRSSSHHFCGWPVSVATTTVTTSLSLLAPPTLVTTTSRVSSAPIVSTASSNAQDPISSCAADFIRIANSVDALNGIKEGDPNFIMAMAMRSLADSIAVSCGSVGQKVDVLSVKSDQMAIKTDEIANSFREFQVETRGYFVKTSSLEASVTQLVEENRVLSRSVADAKAEARAARKGFECDVLKFVGLPCRNPEQARQVVMAFGPLVGFKISANAIESINFGPQLPEPGGPDELVADAVSGRPKRARDIFVKFVYPELRDIILKFLTEKKGITLRDLDPSSNDDRPVRAYEMLTQERYRLYRRLAAEAKRLRFHAVWHSQGSFFVRVKSDGPAKRVYDVDDVTRLSE